MAINAAALTLAIPAASKLAVAAIDRASEAFSFSSIFGQDATKAETSALTFGQQLDALSQNLRQWLSNQGIQSPFEIALGTRNSDTESELAVHGVDGEKIQQLLSQNPDRLQGLRQLLSSIQAMSQSLGRDCARVSITDIDNQIIY